MLERRRPSAPLHVSADCSTAWAAPGGMELSPDSGTVEPGARSDQLIDRLRQVHVALGDPARFVRRQPEIDAVPDAGELRMVTNLFRMNRNAGQKAECFGEILEAKTLFQCFAVGAQRPSVRRVHRVPLSLSCNYFLSYRHCWS